ncbi:TetR/AcrR family transcriptional regulator [Sandarakinorhabdus sp.]|uniref:TetR/AcrR family transcriptional regulator n=1 Tax=Sandarakinorhabdus sp. TaxID=1916663 RepID=UPI003F72B8BB
MATRALDSRSSAPARSSRSAAASAKSLAKAPDMRARRYDPAETKSRVLAAAHMLFSRQGFANTGTADIAREADVSEGSIFYHFGSKKALLEELGRRHGEAMIEAMEAGYTLEELEPDITIPRVLRFVRDNMIWEGMEGDCAECGPKSKMAATPDAEPFYHAAKEVTTNWIQRHLTAVLNKQGVTDVEIDLAASFTHHIVGDAIDRWLCAPSPEEADRIERETIRFVRAGSGYRLA